MFARVLRAINAPYRDGVARIYVWGLVYLGLLWGAAAWDQQWLAVTLMWLVGILIFPFAYLHPTTLGIFSIIEWLNRRDAANRWNTFRVGVLLFICIMSAGGLALLLGMMGAGMAFPIVIPMILVIVATMGYANKTNTERWMVVLAVIAAFIAVFSTLKVMPFGEVARDVYDSTGYSVNVAPSRAEVAARKAFAENERLADAYIGQCIESWKREHMGRRTVVREDEIAKAVEDCNKKYRPVLSSPSRKDGAGSPHGGAASKAEAPSVWRDPGGWFMYHWEKHPWYVIILLLAHFIPIWLWRRWRNKNTTTVTTKVVEKTKVAGTVFGWTLFEWMVGLAVIWLVLSIVAGTFITSMDDLNRVFERKPTAEKVAGYPGQFMTMDELRHWQAEVVTPRVHPFFGDMSGALELAMLADTGKRADIVSRFGDTKGLIVMVDKLDPRKDIVFNNNVCPAAKIPAGGNRHQTVCTSTGRSGDGSLRFSVEMGWSATERYAVLIQSDGGTVIKLRFTPKYP